MTLNNILVFTAKGSHTDDNRDVIAYAKSPCESATLIIVCDGATSSPNSGEFARRLTDLLLDRFSTFTPEDVTHERSLIAALRHAQKTLQKEFVCAAASILLALVQGQQLLLLGAGDCCLGVIWKGTQLSWISRVHTCANMINEMPIEHIKKDPRRHQLTRVFKAKRFCDLMIERHTLAIGTKIIIATDGFWALPEVDQSTILTGGAVPALMDDASFISATLL